MTVAVRLAGAEPPVETAAGRQATELSPLPFSPHGHKISHRFLVTA